MCAGAPMHAGRIHCACSARAPVIAIMRAERRRSYQSQRASSGLVVMIPEPMARSTHGSFGACMARAVQLHDCMIARLHERAALVSQARRDRATCCMDLFHRLRSGGRRARGTSGSCSRRAQPRSMFGSHPDTPKSTCAHLSLAGRAAARRGGPPCSGATRRRRGEFTARLAPGAPRVGTCAAMSSVHAKLGQHCSKWRHLRASAARVVSRAQRTSIWQQRNKTSALRDDQIEIEPFFCAIRDQRY